MTTPVETPQQRARRKAAIAALFPPDEHDDAFTERDAALNNLRAEIFQLRTQLEAARETITELRQENDILRGELETARAWRWAVQA